MINSLEDLDDSSKLAVIMALEEAQFCFEIVELLSVDEEFELRQWQVQTQMGVRRFQTKLTDWPREISGGGLIIQDVHSDLYLIKNLEALPEKSKKILWSYLD